jgi:hypothetical protein
MDLIPLLIPKNGEMFLLLSLYKCVFRQHADAEAGRERMSRTVEEQEEYKEGHHGRLWAVQGSGQAAGRQPFRAL